MSVTIKEIAEHTGLSVPTVGHVLGRGASRYSEQTRRRVMEAARKMGYRPNSTARAMREGKIGCAALVLSRNRQSSHSHIPLGLLDGLDDELASHNMHLAVSRLSDEELSRGDFVPKVLREYMADGMIVNYTHEIPAEMLDLIRAHHTPAVYLNAKLPEDCVYPDDYTAAQAATARLISLGHRRTAFVHFIPSHFYVGPFESAWTRQHYSVYDRDAGYTAACSAAGLTPVVAHHDRYVDEDDQPAACAALLSRPDRPTAVLVYSEHDLSLVMATARELGLAIPRDLSVVTFFPQDPWVVGKHVTAFHVPTAEMGRRAVRMLLKKIASPDSPCPPEVVAYDLAADPHLAGETIAAPPSQPVTHSNGSSKGSSSEEAVSQPV